jgi:poly(3-hydroxybutyrate) depolymerase
MAVQFATAWSSTIKGVGVIAGGPFWCAKADAGSFFNPFKPKPIMTAVGPCMKGPLEDPTSFIEKADAKASAGEIDATQNIGRQKIYLFHGYNDAVVAKSVSDTAADFYRHYLGEANRGNLYYQSAIGAGHSLVVSQTEGSGLNECQANQTPFIDRCGYDQAGIVLQHIYGALTPPNRGPLTGAMEHFDQAVYTRPDGTASLSLADNGYVFVPRDCEAGEACRVHIALHGCQQDVGEIDRRFIDQTGYNSWADTNRIIILYPQTQVSFFNQNACWDWFGYIGYDDSYVTKSGGQIRAIKAMLDALTANARPVRPIIAAAGAAAPNSLAVADVSDTAADLVWTQIIGATTYRVSRAAGDGVFAARGDVAGLSFGDSDLKPQSAYRWRVSAVVNGVEQSAGEAAATTLPAPQPCNTPGTCPIGK